MCRYKRCVKTVRTEELSNAVITEFFCAVARVHVFFIGFEVLGQLSAIRAHDMGPCQSL
jgi:hypothetical protein